MKNRKTLLRAKWKTTMISMMFVEHLDRKFLELIPRDCLEQLNKLG